MITPSFAGWAHVTPFALRHGAQFEVEPGAIFDLTGAAYAREYNEVKQVGDARVRGAMPDSEESDIARFWPGGGSNWNLTARVIVDGRGLDRWQHARLFALLNMAQADAFIANQTWKYTYNFWRPVTAIRWADDGNPDTVSDPTWRPFLVTPPYPDYPCALPTATGAATEVLRQFFGTDDIAFSRTFNAPARPAAGADGAAAGQGDHPQLRLAVRSGRRSRRTPACMPASTSAKAARPVRAKARRSPASWSGTNCGL